MEEYAGSYWHNGVKAKGHCFVIFSVAQQAEDTLR